MTRRRYLARQIVRRICRPPIRDGVTSVEVAIRLAKTLDALRIVLPTPTTASRV